MKSGVDDEAIQTGANLLLTFKQIRNEAGKGNDVFNQATQAAIDLSAAGFGSMDSASKMLGKALNDPIKGITALSRAGVTFTEGQKDQIKTMVESGDVLGAQKAILKEVQGQVGGVAAATATSGEKAAVAFGNIKEAIGTALLPLIDTLARQFLRITPAIQKGVAGAGPLFLQLRAFLQPFVASIAATVVALGTQLAPTIASLAGLVATFVGQVRSGTGAGGAFASVLGTLAGVLGAVFGFISANQAVVATFVGVIATAAVVAKVFAAAQLLVNLALSANPIGIIVIAIAALVAGLVYAYKNSEKFRNGVNALWAGTKAAFSGIMKVVAVALAFIKDHWRLIIVILGGPIGIAVALITKHWSTIKAGAVALLGFIKDHWRLILTILGGPVGLAVALITKYWDKIKAGALGVKTVVVSVFNAIKSAIQAVINTVQSLIDKIGSAISKLSHIHVPHIPGFGRTSAGGGLVGAAVGGSKDDIANAYGIATRAHADGLEKLGKKVKEKVAKLQEALKGLRSDFASLVDPIASAFTGNLFEATTASDFVTSLTSTKGTLKNLSAAFKTLIGQGLNPKFLYDLFQSGNAGLILDLAANPDLAAQAGGLFGDINQLSTELGQNVAGATPDGKAITAKIDKTNEKLDKLIKATHDGADRTGAVINSAAGAGHRRGRHGGRRAA